MLLSMKARARALTDTTRDVKVSRNRHVRLPADYARQLGIKPGAKLISTIAWLPGIGRMVVFMPKPVSHAKELAALIAGDAPEGAEAYVRKLRREWRKRSARYSVEIV
jgi:bifunctional DNA-binding transcriptional regulator/antitoxin component of YhaV-PrlF toxin-antitoxin module